MRDRNLESDVCFHYLNGDGRSSDFNDSYTTLTPLGGREGNGQEQYGYGFAEGHGQYPEHQQNNIDYFFDLELDLPREVYIHIKQCSPYTKVDYISGADCTVDQINFMVAFANAETQEEQDNILGILELSVAND